MKRKDLSLCVGALVLVPAVLPAATYEVANVDEFKQAWMTAQAGDSVVLKQSLDVSSIDWGDEKEGLVLVTSQEGSQFALTWSGAAGPLPAAMKLERIDIAGASGTPLVGGELAVGQGNRWLNNAGAVTVGQTLTVGSGNRWEDNARDGNGGALLVQKGATAQIAGGNIFENNHAVVDGGAGGLGGAIRLDEGAKLALASSREQGNIVFSHNTDNASRENGTLTPGTSNDISLGAGSSVEVDAATGSSVILQGGLRSDDETANVVKKGNGSLVLGESSWYAGSLAVEEGLLALGEKTLFGDGTSASSVRVGPGAAMSLQAGSVLNAPLEMDGATLLVAGHASLLSATVSLSGDNVWVLQPGNAQVAADATLLSLAPDTKIEQTNSGSLTLNLDLRGLTSLGGATELHVVNLGDLTDADTQKLLAGAQVSVTDAAGTRFSNEMLDSSTGSLRWDDLLASIRFDRPGRAAANALWSSAGALRAFDGLVRSQLPAEAETPKGTQLWFSGMGHFDSLSGAYRYSGGGYALGLSSLVSQNACLGIAFGQLIGTNKARLDGVDTDSNAKTDQHELMLGLYGSRAGQWNARNAWKVDLLLAYGRTDNKLTANGYRGDWTDDNFAVSARFTWQYRQNDGTCIAPFIGLEWLDGSQDAADFTGRSNWRAQGADLRLLSLPVGIGIYRSLEAGNGKIFTPQLELLYRGDLVQDAPESAASDGYAAWRNKGKAPGRNALEARVRLHLQITPTWGGYMGGGVETRSDRTVTRVSAGVNYTF